MTKPELLCPAGSVESFYAAIEGGANAVYLGLKQFNARGRASNFNPKQLMALIGVAHEKNVKVYLTLNTVLKNSEISEMLDILAIISKIDVDAVIIQDWGLFFLLNKHFPRVAVHASTQMANHNSLGVNFSGKLGFERVILARELTFKELELAAERSKYEIEIFVHGALCYSFSGLCLLSSFVGGRGANRGLCAQPCRRTYTSKGKEDFYFSLKDNEQINLVEKFEKIGISSLKIEGRMKSASYVYRVAQAYRMAIDNPKRIKEASELLKLDMGREKTGYFLGGDVRDAITISPNTGFFLGKVTGVIKGRVFFNSSMKLKHGSRLFFRSGNTSEIESIKIIEREIEQNGESVSYPVPFKVSSGDSVYLASMKEASFQTKLPDIKASLPSQIPKAMKSKMISSLSGKDINKKKSQVFIRVDDGSWMRKLRLDELDAVVLRLSLRQFKDIPLEAPFMKKNSAKIWFELPKFMPETDIDKWENQCASLEKSGYNRFLLGNLSQKELLSERAIFATNENVYVYNDAAARFFQRQNSQFWIYPFENEMDNVLQGKDRNGMVCMYYYPELFYSRMPVKIEESSEEWFTDELGNRFQKRVHDRMTIVIPEKPVCLFQYKERLSKTGFHRFMIDLSHVKPSKHIVKRLMNKLHFSEQVQPSVTFNFKKGLI